MEALKPKYDVLGPKFKAKGGEIGKALEATEPSKIKDGKVTVDVDGESLTIDDTMFEVTWVKDKVTD